VRITGRLVDGSSGPPPLFPEPRILFLVEIKKKDGAYGFSAGEFNKQGVFVTPPQASARPDGRFLFELEPGFFDQAKEYSLSLGLSGGVLRSEGKAVSFRVGPAARDIDLGTITIR
jgi:hypothetical protein